MRFCHGYQYGSRFYLHGFTSTLRYLIDFHVCHHSTLSNCGGDAPACCDRFSSWAFCPLWLAWQPARVSHFLSDRCCFTPKPSLRALRKRMTYRVVLGHIVPDVHCRRYRIDQDQILSHAFALKRFHSRPKRYISHFSTLYSAGGRCPRVL